jgi:hypothetical protein
MSDNYGFNFAPTQDNSLQGPRNGDLAGLPAAIKVLALRMPRFANAPSPLFGGGGGAQGVDPVASAVLATIAQAVAKGGGHAMGLPGGTAGPDPGHSFPSPAGASPFMPSAPDPGVGGAPEIGKPNVVFAPQPGGTAGPGPFVPRRPSVPGGFRGRIPV